MADISLIVGRWFIGGRVADNGTKYFCRAHISHTAATVFSHPASQMAFPSVAIIRPIYSNVTRARYLHATTRLNRSPVPPPPSIHPPPQPTHPHPSRSHAGRPEEPRHQRPKEKSRHALWYAETVPAMIPIAMLAYAVYLVGTSPPGPEPLIDLLTQYETRALNSLKVTCHMKSPRHWRRRGLPLSKRRFNTYVNSFKRRRRLERKRAVSRLLWTSKLDGDTIDCGDHHTSVGAVRQLLGTVRCVPLKQATLRRVCRNLLSFKVYLASRESIPCCVASLCFWLDIVRSTGLLPVHRGVDG